LNLGDRIHAFLESCRDCYNFHDSAGNTLLIVVPVDKLTHVEVLESIVFKPFAKELLLDSLICFENGCGNSSICHFSFDWQLGNDKLHIETLVFHDFRSKKFGETLSASDRCTFLSVIITKVTRKEARLSYKVNYILFINVFTLSLKNIIPSISDFTTGIITFLQGLSFQEF
jgi:hypothetical protein